MGQEFHEGAGASVIYREAQISGTDQPGEKVLRHLTYVSKYPLGCNEEEAAGRLFSVMPMD